MVIDLSGLTQLGQGLAQAQNEQRQQAYQNLQLVTQRFQLMNQLYNGAIPTEVLGPLMEQYQAASKAAGVPLDLPGPAAGAGAGGAGPTPVLPQGVGGTQAAPTGPFSAIAGGPSTPQPATSVATPPATAGPPAPAQRTPMPWETLPPGVGQPGAPGPFTSMTPPPAPAPNIATQPPPPGGVPGTPIAGPAPAPAPAPAPTQPAAPAGTRTYTDPKTGKTFYLPAQRWDTQTVEQAYDAETAATIRSHGIPTNVPMNMLPPDMQAELTKYLDPTYREQQATAAAQAKATLATTESGLETSEQTRIEHAVTDAAGVVAGMIGRGAKQEEIDAYIKSLPPALQAKADAIMGEAGTKADLAAKTHAESVAAQPFATVPVTDPTGKPVLGADGKPIMVPVTAKELLDTMQKDRQFAVEQARLREQADRDRAMAERANAAAERAAASGARADQMVAIALNRQADEEHNRNVANAITIWNSADMQKRPDSDPTKQAMARYVGGLLNIPGGYVPTGSLKPPPSTDTAEKNLTTWQNREKLLTDRVNHPEQFGYDASKGANAVFPDTNLTMAATKAQLASARSAVAILQGQAKGPDPGLPVPQGYTELPQGAVPANVTQQAQAGEYRQGGGQYRGQYVWYSGSKWYLLPKGTTPPGAGPTGVPLAGTTPGAAPAPQSPADTALDRAIAAAGGPTTPPLSQIRVPAGPLAPAAGAVGRVAGQVGRAITRVPTVQPTGLNPQQQAVLQRGWRGASVQKRQQLRDRYLIPPETIRQWDKNAGVTTPP